MADAMTGTTKAKAPIWVLAVLGVMTGLPILFTVMSYTDPTPQFGTWKAFHADGAFALTGPMGFYLARNIATVGVSLYALATRRRDTLFMALLLRVLTDFMDGVHFVTGDSVPSGAVTAFIITAIELAALLRVRRLAR